MNIRLIVSIVLFCCYFVSSSSLSHAFAMEHVGLHEQPVEVSGGCADHAVATHTKNADTDDCLERCLGPYKDFGGIAQYTLREACLLSCYEFITDTLSFQKQCIDQLRCLDDPPNLVGFGYAIIGKEIKKVE